ncbi:MAG: hypothetical protein IKM88_07155 [Lachnospiraceae bacterium]|nr:hypothetical protein [Lachnospiraceae bacterium]
MSKNIVIAEGRRGRRFGAVKKLRTKLQGGGDCLWVPEEEVQRESLYAYENGVYRPEQYGFDRASVSVIDATLTPLDTGLNVPSFPPAGTDGFSQVTVNVPESEQDTYMDAVQLKCVGIPTNKPYSVVLFSRWEDIDNGFRWYAECSAYYYSAFPFFVRWVDNGSGIPVPRIYTFARGNSSVRVETHWENHANPNRTHDTNALDDAYVRNQIVDYGDNFSGNIGTAYSTFRSRQDNGVDNYSSTPIYCTIVNEGEHLGSYLNQASSVYMLKQDSTIPSEEEVSPVGYQGIYIRMAILQIPPRNGTGNYSQLFYTGPYGDYRVINNKSFATMEEWLTWCKTH